MNIDHLAVARVLLVVASILGLAGIAGGVLLVVAYLHDRVRRLGWFGLLRHLCRPHPADEAQRPAAPVHPHFTRHRRTLP